MGVGASAGGIRALKPLLEALPADTGYAIVVVVHLHPDFESGYAAIIQRFTDMPVTEVSEQVALKANQIYIITPGCNLETIDSHLRPFPIEDQAASRAPIDHFFQALSVTHGDQAIGVLLSGTGSDGVSGLRRLKAAGGIVMVQDPSEAEYDAMPRNAINAGLVDLVLSASEIARKVTEIRVSSPVIAAVNANELSADDQDVLQKIITQIRLGHGADFSRYKVSTILRRIRRRMQLHRIATLEKYLQVLRQNVEEKHALFQDFMITVTDFFRDPHVFEVLEKDVIPRLFEGKTAEDTIRVWAAGCSSGEEVYSLAILLAEYRATLDSPPGIQVFASDINKRSLAKGRLGVYPNTIEARISAERLERFFTGTEDNYRIKDELRDIVVFAPHSMLRDPPFSRMDLISCRNVLIYLERPVQKELFDLFHYAIVPEGFLLLGTAENIETHGGFQPFRKDANVFQRRRFGGGSGTLPSLRGQTSLPTTVAAVDRNDWEKSMSYAKMHKRVLERFGPPSILINSEQDIVHFSEHAGRYLYQPGGEPTNNVFRRVREEFRVELRTAVFAASRRGGIIRSRPVRVTIEGEEERVAVRVQVPRDDEGTGYVLIMFDPQEAADSNADTRTETEAEAGAVKELEEELDDTRQRLQTIIEEYETSQEEMRSANEELQSTNEELRSAMEELETGKEELQSVNEELTTVNQENRIKVEELSRTTSDLNNFLAATDIATVFLDRDLRVMRFTPQATEFFHLRESDIGRDITELTHAVKCEGIDDRARQVLRSLERFEAEVRDKRGGWHLLRILPYRTADDHIEGVVMTLVDIATTKAAEERALASAEELRALTASLEERVAERTQEVRSLASRLTLAEQRERNRIAQLLHDDLQQLLSSIRLQLHLMETSNVLDSEQSSEIDSMLAQAVDQTRRLSVDLSPPVLDQEGLGDALRWLRTQMADMHQLTVSLNAETGYLVKDRDLRVLLFQIIRELLFNVVKHAGVNEAQVTLNEAAGWLKIEVIDHGAGFDPSRLSDDSMTGFGLNSVRERLELFGGRVSIFARLDEGCRVTVEVPVKS